MDMVIKLTKREVYWLNCFPLTDGISDTLSPHTIVTGQTVAVDRHCKYGFGDYVQTHEPHDNSMAPRTGSPSYWQHTRQFLFLYSLSTGRVML